MPLPLSQLMLLAQVCAPGVAPTTLAAVAAVESGFRPLTIRVNGAGGRTLAPRDPAEAVRAARALIAAGRSIDLGLGQINSRNLKPLGLPLTAAFDPCQNLAASARLLAAGYRRARLRPEAEQAALRTALSYYNTGDPLRGAQNGYVARVVRAAATVVPPIDPTAQAKLDENARQIAAAPSAGLPEPAPAANRAPPPAWDVFARAQLRPHAWILTQAQGDRP